MSPGDKIVPFQGIFHLAVNEAIDQIDKIGNAINAARSYMKVRRISKPLSNSSEHTRQDYSVT